MKILTDKNTEIITKWNNPDPAWRTIVHDHRAFLLQGASTIQISNADQNKYKYRISDYLKSRQLEGSQAWIIAWLNQIGSNRNFINISELLIPTHTKLQELYKKYTTANKLMAKLK